MYQYIHDVYHMNVCGLEKEKGNLFRVLFKEMMPFFEKIMGYSLGYFSKTCHFLKQAVTT